MLERKYKVKEPVEKPEFTVKQQRFIDAYDGDIKKAAVKAEITYQYARRCATKSNIMAAIKSRQDTEVRPNTIMNRQQRQEFWTKVAESEDEAMRDRLRASELLGKSNADFVEVHLDVKKSVLSPEDAQAIIDENEKRFWKEENERWSRKDDNRRSDGNCGDTVNLLDDSCDMEKPT